MREFLRGKTNGEETKRVEKSGYPDEGGGSMVRRKGRKKEREGSTILELPPAWSQ